MTEMEFMQKIEAAGGTLYIAGGWVRDYIRGIAAKDKDYVICGLKEAAFQAAFPEAFKVGAAFPVYLLWVDGEKCEVAFARKEKKTGIGYRGFRVLFDDTVTIEEDLYRRDTTMNSMAYDIKRGTILDPYGGTVDVKMQMIRATSLHFSDDPVRALRAARQAAQFNFSIEPSTLEAMRRCGPELALEAPERLAAELNHALATTAPSVFFHALQAADLLRLVFPELFALIGQTQPSRYHPEGDAFIHSMQVMDRVAQISARPEVRFAALVHDIGKGRTPLSLLPHHYGHERAGLEVLRDWNRRMTLPGRWLKCAVFAISEHMRVHVLKKPGKIVDFISSLAKHPLGPDGFSAIIRADSGRLPDVLENFEKYQQVLASVVGSKAPAGLTGAAVGAWIRQERIRKYRALLGEKECRLVSKKQR